MKRTLKFSFSLIISILVFMNARAQDTTLTRIRGLRLGVDLSRLALKYIEPERSGYGFSADYEAFKNFYPKITYGWQTLSLNNYGWRTSKLKEKKYSYSSQGSYWTIGFEYNTLKKIRFNQYEMVFVGLSYGFSNFTHHADSIYINDNHWGSYYTSVGPLKYRDGWIEISSGIRAQLFKNFFIGWYFSGRLLLWRTHHSPLVPVESPGFGTVQQKASLGFNYSIYYRIPLFKVKYKK